MKKLLSLLLCLVMVAGTTVTASAANEFKDAPNFSFGGSVNSTINDSNKSDIYKLELATSGKIAIDLTAQIFRLNLTLQDKNGKEIWTEKQTSNETTKEISYKNELTLCKGTYYITVSKNSGEGDYKLTITELPITESFTEEQGGSNNTPKTANPIAMSTSYTGCIATNDDTDTYGFEIKSSGKLVVNLKSDISKLKLKLCDESSKEAWSDRPACDDTNTINYTSEIYMNKGKYFFSVAQNEGYGEYSFDISFTPVDETFAEPHGGSNNDVDKASVINVNQKYNGLLASNDNVDFYEFQLDGGEVEFNVSSKMESVQLKLYDHKGKAIWWDKSDCDSATKENNFSKKIKVEHGKYFFSIEKAAGEGEYVFYVSDGGVVSEAAASGSVITVRVNGKNIAFDQPPVIEDGRTLVPLRAIFEALGAEVAWDGATQTVSASKKSINISLQIGSNVMLVNGAEKALDVPAKIVGGRTLVPVRAISEAFECAVSWDGKTKTVTINNN